ncbi:MAG: hypothetical protein ACREMZ_13560 [Gemmatimonadales bacterium]
MVTKLVVSILLMTSLINACGGRDDEVGEVVSEKQVAEASRILQQGPPTSPIDIVVHADEDTKATEIIGPAGGTVRVTGPGGTRFTLELPKNAVPESTGITMTPVDSVSDLPFNGGLVGAVQLSPDGLVLAAPATLTIESAKRSSEKDQVAFGAAGDGQGVYLVPLMPAADQIRLSVAHFSIHGSATAVPGAVLFENGSIKWNEGYWPTPKNPLDLLQQEIAKALKEHVILEALGWDPDSPEFQEATRRAAERVRAATFLYLQDLARRLRALEADCSDLDAAGKVLAEYKSFTRPSALFTEGGPETSSIDPLVQRVVESCARQALERCRAGIIKGGLDMKDISRQFSAIGFAPPYSDAEWKDLEKCPPIKLVIEDNNEVEFQDSRGKAMLGVPKVTEKSRHVYRGFLYMNKDSLWRGGVDVDIEGTYSTIDEKATLKRMQEVLPPGNIPKSMSFEQMLTVVLGTMKFFASEIPSCKGSYTGSQFFTIEGSFTTGDQGQEQVELAILPIQGKGPDFYRTTPECPWLEEKEIDGTKVIPTRLVEGQETAIVIDPPRQGMPIKKYVIPVQAEGIRAETIITVGGK